MLKLKKQHNRLDIRQFLVLLYDCLPNMKHVWNIERLVKNANVLESGTGKNPTSALYSKTTKPESFNVKKTIKICKNNKMITCL